MTDGLRATAIAVVMAAAACGSTQTLAPPAPAPAAGVETSCALVDGAVACRATNHSPDATVACAEPWVGVTRTGALITGDSKACSPALAPGASAAFAAPVRDDLHRACAQAGDCVVRVFDGADPVPAILAWGHELAARATEVDPDHPSLADCERATDAWVRRSDDPRYHDLPRGAVTLLCLALARPTFDCLDRAQSDAEAERCD